jgi:hypothetical protein
VYRNMIVYVEELLAPRLTPKLDDHLFSAVRDCLFNVFAAAFHVWKPFVHPQPEGAPCRGDRDPLTRLGISNHHSQDGVADGQQCYLDAAW